MNPKKIEITYFEDGKKIETELRIELVPNHAYREFKNISEATNEYLVLHTEIVSTYAMMRLQQDRAQILSDPKNKSTVKEDDIKDCTEKLNIFLTKIDELKAKMEKYQHGNECDIYSKKIDLIMWILKQNGFEDKFLKFEFWDQNLNQDEIHDFLVRLCTKDILPSDGKKKAV